MPRTLTAAQIALRAMGEASASLGATPQTVVRLTRRGCERVLDGKEGMTFVVDHFTKVIGYVAHVRDYRYPQRARPYQVWSLGDDCYEVIS